jgi:hypothetical protein
VGDPQQHYIMLWHSASDGCNADQMLKLSRAKRSSAAGGHTASLSGLYGNRAQS